MQNKSQKKYNDLLDHLDLQPVKEEKKTNIDTSGLNLDDLLKTSKTSNSLSMHIQNLSQQKKVSKPLYAFEKDKIDRSVAYKIVKQEVSDWQGQIKKNREAQQLDFRDEKKKNLKQINDDTLFKKNSLLTNIENKAKELKLDSEQNIIQQEKQMLQGDAENLKSKIKLLQKERNLNFQQELKYKRIKKIKSKLYHRIKNKKLNKNQDEQQENIENLERIRAEERMGLRHSSKSKYVKNLLRFGGDDKKNIQNSINDVSNKHKNLVKKINNIEGNSNASQEYDEENYRQQAMDDLQVEMEGDVQKTGLKFLDNYMEKKNIEAKKAAQELLIKLQNDEEISVDEEKKDDNFQGRQKFKNDQETTNTPSVKKQDMKRILEQFLQAGDTQQSVTVGLNLQNVKQKYKQEKQVQFEKSDWEVFQKENEEDLQNFNIVTIQDNHEDFQQEKNQILEENIPQPEKKKSGWGSWAGKGVQTQLEDPQKELERKKAEIQNLKRKRQDGNLDNVIINESRIKNVMTQFKFSQFLVQDLPYNYTKAEQFDFIQSKIIAPEVMTGKTFERNVQAKVITKKGTIINPILKKQKKV